MKKQSILNLTFMVIIGVLVVVSTVKAATTISTNIVTEGALSVTGTSTFMGRLGIGTSTPSRRVNIYDTTSPREVVQLDVNLNSWYSTIRVDNINNAAGSIAGIDFYAGAPGVSNGLTILSQSDATAFGETTGTAYIGATGGLEISTTGVYFPWSEVIGIGTSTPTTNLQVTAIASNATSTLTIGKVGQNKGTCHEEFRVDGSVIYWWWTAGGAMATSSVSCK